MKESKFRSLIKAISWRILASIITAGTVFIFTKQVLLAFSIGLLDTFIKIFIYFFHERIWARIPYGRPSHPLEDLKIKKDLSNYDKEIIYNKLKDIGYIEEDD